MARRPDGLPSTPSLLRKHAPFQHSSSSSLRVAPKGFLPLSHASRRAAGGSTGTLHACARPIDNDSVSACAPGTACRASTLRCVVISLRTGFSASYFLRLAMPVQVLRTFPATARCALVSPASLLGALFLLRKTVPFSRPRRRSRVTDKLKIVIFRGFRAAKSGREYTKKDQTNSAGKGGVNRTGKSVARTAHKKRRQVL